MTTPNVDVEAEAKRPPATLTHETLPIAPAHQAFVDLAERLSQATGVQLRRLGGIGAFGLASIRGSNPNQVNIYLDGIRLNAPGFAAVNLGDLPLVGIDTAEVFRSGNPEGQDDGGLGGAIFLNSSQDEGFQLGGSYGSFDTLRFAGSRSARLGRWRLNQHLGFAHTDGDFRYLNPNGTLNNFQDDRFTRRQNNAFLGVSSIHRVERKSETLSWRMVHHAFYKDQGLPGLDSVSTREAGLRTLRSTTALRIASNSAQRPRFAEVQHLFLGERLSDALPPSGELGARRRTGRTRSHRLNLRGVWTFQERHQLKIRLGTHTQLERFAYSERFAQIAKVPRDRLRQAVSVKIGYTPVRTLAIDALYRAELLWSRFEGGTLPDSFAEFPDTQKTDGNQSGRIGLRQTLDKSTVLQCNMVRGVRVPDLGELFGDRGQQIGNPNLQSERSWAWDVGLQRQEKFGTLRLDAEITGFLTTTKDLIVLVQNSQSTLRPENLDRARAFGVEARVATTWRGFRWLANYTWLDARNRGRSPAVRGKRIPGRPTHQVHTSLARLWDAATWNIRPILEADFVGGNALDTLNLRQDLLARLFVNAKVLVGHKASGTSVSLEVRNLFDQLTVTDAQGQTRPVRDFLAFPLPGRVVTVTAGWTYP